MSTTFALALSLGVLLLLTLWYAVRPVARAIAEEEEAGERLIDVYQNPQQSSSAEHAYARTLGYTTVLEAYGPLDARQPHVLTGDGVSLRALHWQPNGALLELDVQRFPRPEGLYLQAWDDNGVFLRPLRQTPQRVDRVTRLWRNAAWVDSAALRTEHCSESGLLLEVRHTRDTSLLFSMITQQPSEHASVGPIDVLTPWVLLLQLVLPPQSLPPAIEALAQALDVDAQRLHTPPEDLRDQSHDRSLCSLVLEGALRFDIYATGALLAVLASQRPHLRPNALAEVEALIVAFDAGEIWGAEVPSEAVEGWRHAEALRTLGVSPDASQADAIAALEHARTQAAEDALTLDETGLDELVYVQSQHLSAVEKLLSR